MFERNRTRPFLIRYALYLYFLGLSLKSTSKALEPFVDRSYVAIYGIGYSGIQSKGCFSKQKEG